MVVLDFPCVPEINSKQTGYCAVHEGNRPIAGRLGSFKLILCGVFLDLVLAVYEYRLRVVLTSGRVCRSLNIISFYHHGR